MILYFFSNLAPTIQMMRFFLFLKKSLYNTNVDILIYIDSLVGLIIVPAG